jgi:PAS domain S-box-containing protein
MIEVQPINESPLPSLIKIINQSSIEEFRSRFMNQKIKILHVEDSNADAGLVEREIRKAGLHFELLLVSDKENFSRGLVEFQPDIILSDHSLPDMDSREALELTRLHRPGVPFILITATVSEEYAVEIMRRGASDYILKDRLQRLPKAIENAIEKWTAEMERQKYLHQIVASEARYRQIVETAQEGIWLVDEEYRITFVNQRMCQLLGYTKEEILGRRDTDFMDEEWRGKFVRIERDTIGKNIDLCFITKEGKHIWANLSASAINDPHGNFKGALEMVTDITTKKLAENKLKQERLLLRTLIDNLPDYVFVKDVQGRHLFNNMAIVELFGFQTEEETLGKQTSDLLQDVQFAEFIDDDKQVLELGKSIINKEECITTFEGEKRWLLTSKIPFKDDAGNIAGLIGISRDITELKQIAETLAARVQHDIEERMRAMKEIEKLSHVASKTDNGVMITDADQKIEWVNESFVRMTGYTLEEIKGNTFNILKGPETDLTVDRWMNRKIQQGESFSGELINYSKSGRKYWLKLSIAPVFHDDGEIKNFIFIQSDITQQKEFQNKITAIARELSTLIENANVPIFAIDRNGYINEWNKISAEISGIAKSELLGKRWINELVESDQRHAAEQMIARVLRGNSISNLELPVFIKNRKRLILLLNAYPRRDAEKVVNGAIFVAQDITELIEYRRNLEKMVQDRTRELNEALQKEKELVNMKSKFVSIASHEFRTPLTTITLATGLLKKFRSKITPEEVDEKLVNIEKQVNHMTHLLDDVLMIGKVEAGKIPVKLLTIDTIDFFDRLCKEIEQTTLGTHRIRLKHYIQTPTIFSDEKLLRNIVINALTNAIKFSPDAKHVDLTLKGDSNKLVLHIRDYGIGIPQDDMKELFEPFYRGSNVTAIQGTGLGLSIMKKGVDRLKGFIDVKSEVGKGTELIITLPTLLE